MAGQKHVDYILAAEFHVDTGPMIAHQYPEPLSGDVKLLAELMLPDQIHTRAEDWTVFFLHQNEPEGSGGESSGGGNDDNLSTDSEPPLIYVLNLVNTKTDPAAKRGATVKSIAVCTRHPFVHIYKPILLLALEDYFRNSTSDVLEHLYHSLNNMDLSDLPTLNYLERTIMLNSNSENIFRDRFFPQRGAIINLHGTQRSNSSSGIKRVPSDTHEHETSVIYRDLKVPIKIPIASSADVVGDPSIVQLIVAFTAPQLSSPQRFPLHPHLTPAGPFTHPIIVLINALLTQKRIVFLGHGRPSGEVAQYVLAACALGSGGNGTLRGFTERAFPYTDLSKIDDLLTVPGFIVGVTNPLFEMHPEWWDVLCDIDTGRIRISEQLAVNTNELVSSNNHLTQTQNVFDNDSVFMDEIMNAVQFRATEISIRRRCREWLWRFIRMVSAYEELTYKRTHIRVCNSTENVPHGYVWLSEIAKQKELSFNQFRFEAFRKTVTYYNLVKDCSSLFSYDVIPDFDLYHSVDLLRHGPRLSDEESTRLIISLNEKVQTYDAINLFLCAYPGEDLTNLRHFAMALFHPHKPARIAAASLLNRIRHHPAGAAAVEDLGRMIVGRLQESTEGQQTSSASPKDISAPILA